MIISRQVHMKNINQCSRQLQCINNNAPVIFQNSGLCFLLLIEEGTWFFWSRLEKLRVWTVKTCHTYQENKKCSNRQNAAMFPPRPLIICFNQQVLKNTHAFQTNAQTKSNELTTFSVMKKKMSSSSLYTEIF